ncbi:hypothetical protein PDN30_15970 [Bacillus cereus]|nr:hypothetical protein [Bacillus cereus]
MANMNPYSSDKDKGEAWEQGYLAGFTEPDKPHDYYLVVSPEILQAYQEGVKSGHDDRYSLSTNSGGPGAQSELAEVARDIGLTVIGHMFMDMLFGAAGGLISVVVEVLKIPGDVQLQKLDDNWSGPCNQSNDTYVAVCPRKDHQQVLPGVSSDGYWAGNGHSKYEDALAEMQAHGHAEAFVVRCNVSEGTCGAVWPG